MEQVNQEVKKEEDLRIPNDDIYDVGLLKAPV